MHYNKSYSIYKCFTTLQKSVDLPHILSECMFLHLRKDTKCTLSLNILHTTAEEVTNLAQAYMAGT